MLGLGQPPRFARADVPRDGLLGLPPKLAARRGPPLGPAVEGALQPVRVEIVHGVRVRLDALARFDRLRDGLVDRRAERGFARRLALRPDGIAAHPKLALARASNAAG